jgi:Arc/MetJ-type ribon-helix-helix transcriptional regulator
MPRRKDLVIWSVPVTRALDLEVETAVRNDMHVSKSDLIREAVREKLKRMGFMLTVASISSHEENSDKGEVRDE